MERFRYEQSTGRLLLSQKGQFIYIATGYAGAQGFVNDPDAQCKYAKGPLPRGEYTMQVRKHQNFASPAIFLIPWEANDMCGRSRFYIHGDNQKGNGTASTGCIILNHSVRSFISSAMGIGFRDLEVVI